MCIGPKPLRKHEECTRPIQEGDYVLTDMLRYADYWPQIGRVESFTETELSIVWYNGTLNGPWKPHMLRKKGLRQLVPWTESISRHVVWRHGFQLTERGFIPKYLKDAITSYHDD